jgi:hypothetical protein
MRMRIMKRQSGRRRKYWGWKVALAVGKQLAFLNGKFQDGHDTVVFRRVSCS